ncbi:inositol monophosphatase family protein [Jannaschia rubra]|uniref:Inositol-1-monophosphatase n=1 Tax=Jannaschia rubra TaxID=282197 RepID=A0A0M6XLV1_9RHOB|nr:inositol monophosphatase [Jannaschia rubra]CTQ31547.1 Inositol-1-monophosphatase [Jannaschia rubra]SFF77453.1 fructose-1,6-bisphosphatase [Jannaschia rubra]
MPLTDLQSTAIIEAVREVAAAEILPRFRNLADGEVDAKAAFDDLVTVADKAAEEALTARIHAILPGDAVVGEEAVAEDGDVLDRVGQGRVTVIDPIDGTWNYAHGIGNYGVIVAVVEDGATVWGMLYDPSFDDWIVAHRGGGAWFHRAGKQQRLTTDQADAPFDRLRGNVGGYLFPPEVQPALAATVPLFRRATSMGASLHEYRQLALGGTDFCLNGMMHVWDHAAGVLILQEAGGVSRLLDGSEYRPTMRAGHLLNARNEELWQALAARFNGALTGA